MSGDDGERFVANALLLTGLLQLQPGEITLINEMQKTRHASPALLLAVLKFNLPRRFQKFPQTRRFFFNLRAKAF